MATIGNRDGWKVAYVSVDSEFKYYTSYKKLVLLSCSLIGEFLSGSYCYVFFCLEGSQGVHLLRFSILSSSLLLVRQIWKITSSSSLGGKSENGMRCPCTLWFRIRGLNAMPVASTTRSTCVVGCAVFVVCSCWRHDACNKTTRGTELMNCSLNVMLWST